MERVYGGSPDAMLILQEPKGTENAVAEDKYPLHSYAPYGKNVKNESIYRNGETGGMRSGLNGKDRYNKKNVCILRSSHCGRNMRLA